MVDGIWIPLVTPFRSGKIDVESLQALVEYYARSGITGMVALGTTAEAALLSDVERATVLRTIVDAAPAGLPVIVGVGGLDTREFVKEIDRLEQWDVAGYLVSAPAWLCPDQAGLRWHFERIAGRTQRPIVLYNVPHRTGVSIDPDTVRQLTDHANIVAIKECEPHHFDALRDLPVDVLCGTDKAFLDCLLTGGAGGILASAHVCADLLVDIQRLAGTGHATEARQRFDVLRPVVELLFSAPNPSAIKAMLAFDRLISSEVRMPITPANPALVARLRVAHETLRALRAK
ncbi:MAG TPA: 4-hydroxy-tetrahydrodipicolinate synthase [Paraburkholderia sp.]|jgi:4-hydroxy-tetrahydrodipicolinate synthase|nr:4-hydroxy-tetrahydrodipicolinate synthase [Paraburkholderia sp.]